MPRRQTRSAALQHTSMNEASNTDQAVTSGLAEEEDTPSSQVAPSKPTSGGSPPAESERIELRMPGTPEAAEDQAGRIRGKGVCTERAEGTPSSMLQQDPEKTRQQTYGSRAERVERAEPYFGLEEARQTRLAMQEQGLQLKGIQDALRLLVGAINRGEIHPGPGRADQPASGRDEGERPTNGIVVDGQYVPRASQSWRNESATAESSNRMRRAASRERRDERPVSTTSGRERVMLSSLGGSDHERLGRNEPRRDQRTYARDYNDLDELVDSTMWVPDTQRFTLRERWDSPDETRVRSEDRGRRESMDHQYREVLEGPTERIEQQTKQGQSRSREEEVEAPISRSRSSQGTMSTNPQPPRSNKVALYDGTTPLRDYLKTFERVADINNWSEAQKCDALATHLAGAAQQVYTDAPENVGYSYNKLVAELRAVFEPAGQAEFFQAQLIIRRREKGEGWPQLGQAIRRLVRQSYPEADQVTQDRLAREAFIDAIDDRDLRSKVRDKEPETLNRAVQTAVRCEAYQEVDKAKADRGRTKKLIRRVEFRDEPEEMPEETDGVWQAVNKLTEEVRNTKRQIATSRSPDNRADRDDKGEADVPGLPFCFNCGKKDHMMYTCPEVGCFRCGKMGHWARDCKEPAPRGYSPRSRRNDRDRSYSPRNGGQQRRNGDSPGRSRQDDGYRGRRDSPGRGDQQRDRSGGRQNSYDRSRKDSRDRYEGSSPYRNSKRSPSDDRGKGNAKADRNNNQPVPTQTNQVTASVLNLSGTDGGEMDIRIDSSTNGTGMAIDGKIQGATIAFTVDTGASITILSSAAYDQISEGLRPNLRPTAMRLHQANDSLITTRGEALMLIEFGVEKRWTHVVVAEIKSFALLGNNFIADNGCVLDYTKNSFVLGRETLTMYSLEKVAPRIGMVRAGQTITIPAHTTMPIPAQIDDVGNMQGAGLIEPSNRARGSRMGYVIGRTVVNYQQSELQVPVLNVSDADLTIHAKTRIGRIVPLEEASTAGLQEKEINKAVNLVRAVGDNPNMPALSKLLPGEIDESGNELVPVVAEVKPEVKGRLAGCKEAQQLQETLQSLWLNSIEALDKDEERQLAILLRNYADVFSTGPDDIGRTPLVKHRIRTGDTAPIKQHPRRLPLSQQQSCKEEVQKMLKHDVIRPSASPWASPIVIVKKKDGSLRFCIDYRKLNAATIKDAYPLPRIDDSLDCLSGSKWFCTLDLASGFWQVEMDPEDREKTAFCTRGGLYEFNTMPFGLCNAPGTFERLMELVLAGLQWEICLIYIDDVIVFSKTVEETITRLGQVLERFREAGLKLKPKKCLLLQKQVAYLGHIISESGIATNPEKVKVVKDSKEPQDVSELRGFLGVTSYYRRFVKGYSDIAAPLNKLLSKNVEWHWDKRCHEAWEQLKQKLMSSEILSYPRPGSKFILDTDASNMAVGAVLSQIQDGQEKVLAYASRGLGKPERRYCVTRRELLAVVTYIKYFRHYLYGNKFLLRTDHGSLRWIFNFKAPEGQLARWLEVLGIYDFDIQHRPGRLHGNADAMSRPPMAPCKQCHRESHDETWPEGLVMARPQLMATVVKKEEPIEELENKNPALYWSEAESEEELEAEDGGSEDSQTSKEENKGSDSEEEEPEPEKQADKLEMLKDTELKADSTSEESSSFELELTDSEDEVQTEQIDPEIETEQATVPEDQQIKPEVTKLESPGQLGVWEMSLGLPEVAEIAQSKDQISEPAEWITGKSSADLAEEQKKDPVLREVMEMLNKYTAQPKWSDISDTNPDVKAYWAQWNQLLLRDCILYRSSSTNPSLLQLQLVVPKQLKNEILEALHDNITAGHPGIARTTERVKARFYWYRMDADIKQYCQQCDGCNRGKSGRPVRAPLMSYLVGHTMERVSLDTIGPLPVTPRGNRIILVVVENKTRWVEAIPLPDQTAQTVAHAFVTEVVCRFGTPRQVHTDQGKCFEAALFKEMCQILDIDKTRTTAYWPRSNGLVERVNRTIEGMMCHYVSDNQEDWDVKLPLLMMAYRSTPHRSTGLTPNKLMLGREIELPIDLAFGTPQDEEEVTPADYAVLLGESIQRAHELARASLKKSTERQKRDYDMKAEKSGFKVGAEVYYFKPKRQAGRFPKFTYQRLGPYRVTERINMVLYKIQRTPRSREIVVHVDKLRGRRDPD